MDLIDNGQTLLSGGASEDQTIRKWNWQTGELLSKIQVPNSSMYSLIIINLGEFFEK